jgi:hypothetical protein
MRTDIPLQKDRSILSKFDQSSEGSIVKIENGQFPWEGVGRGSDNKLSREERYIFQSNRLKQLKNVQSDQTSALLYKAM